MGHRIGHTAGEAERVRRLMRLDMLAERLADGDTLYAAGRVMGVHSNMIDSLFREMRHNLGAQAR